MFEVRADTAACVVKNRNNLAVFIGVAVRAGKVAADVEVAGESIDAGVVIFRAAGSTVVAIKADVTVGLVIRTPWGQGESTKVVVEGMVLLHDDDDVLYFVQIASGARQVRKH